MGLWESSTLSIQLCCEPKTKNKVDFFFLLKWGSLWIRSPCLEVTSYWFHMCPSECFLHIYRNKHVPEKKERKKVGRWISVQRKVLVQTEGQKETEWDRALGFHSNSGIGKLGHQSGKENTIPTRGFFDTVQLAMTQVCKQTNHLLSLLPCSVSWVLN